ncbi:MAG: ion channel [Candidatus Micrarchaeota archaeon]
MSFLHLEDKMLFLLISLIASMILYPFLEGGGIQEVIIQAVFAFILISGVYAVSTSKRDLIISIALGVPAFLSVIAVIIFQRDQLFHLLNYIFSMLFYAFTITRLLKYITHADKVDNNVIYAAICVYILIGVAWSTVYLTIEQFIPGTFIFSYKESLTARSDLIYFSYTTLTTTGYGDIVSTNSIGRAAAILESVTGVLYVAILISRLVSLYQHEHKD